MNEELFISLVFGLRSGKPCLLLLLLLIIIVVVVP